MRENLEKSPLRVVGLRQVLRAVCEGKAEKVYLADDASPDMQEKVLHAAESHLVPVGHIGSMRALAHLCRVDVPTSCAAVLKSANNS